MICKSVQVENSKYGVGSAVSALRSIADVNAPEISTDDRSRRGESVNVVRYGVNSPTTTQK